MTSLDWPNDVPARLRQRAEELVATVGSTEPDRCIAAAVGVTRGLLRDHAVGRAAALDLLAADALVTHAIAGWSADAEDFEARCLGAMHRIAAIVERS